MNNKKLLLFGLLLSFGFITSCEQNANVSNTPSIKEEINDYTVYYYDNFTNNYPLTLQVKEGEFAQNITSLSRDDYQFSGWYLDQECNEEFLFTTPITSDINLYAKWDKVNFEYYTISFINANLEAIQVKEGDSFSLPSVELDGYRFDGWFNNNISYEIGTSFTPTENMIFEAAFSKYVYLTYDLAGGTGLDILTEQYVVGDTVSITKSTITREDFEFAGWYCNNESYSNEFVISDSITLTAKWIGYYDVIFVDEFGSGTLPNNSEILSGNFITIPAYDGSYEYHKFMGFKDQYGNLYVEGETYEITTEDVIFTAFYKIISYVVTFQDWDGTALYNMTINANESVNEFPSLFVNNIEEFIGWDKSLDELKNINSRTYVTAQYDFSDKYLSADSYKFEETSEGYLIGKKNTSYTGELYLPVTYKGKIVTGTIISSSYSQCGFQGCSSISSIYIPSTYNAINKNAFRGCSSLVNVNGMKNVSIIDLSAFQGCNFSTINLPSSLKNIGESAFSSNKSLINISIPEGVSTLESSVLQDCLSLVEVNLPSTLTSINSTAFRRSANLEKITVSPNNTKYAVLDNILYEIDSNKKPIDLIAVPLGNKNIVDYIIPSSLIRISSNAFNKSVNLKTVTFEKPSSLSYIGTYAFSYVENLSSIELPGTIDTIEPYAFGYISASISFDEGLEIIGKQAFIGYEGVEINLPSSLITIEDMAFYQSGVKVVNIADNSQLSRIGSYAFLECTSLTSFNSGRKENTFIIPDSVTEIGDLAFYKNILIENLTLSKNLKSIGGRAFASELYADANQKADMKTYLPIIEGKLDSLMHIKSLFIPASVESIGYLAFGYNVDLETVVFEDNSMLNDFGANLTDAYATYYGYVFESCINLVSVDFGKNNALELIRMGSFARCVNLKTVNYNVNSKISLMDSSIFIHCINLENVTIPEKTIYLGAQVFMDTAITTMYIPSSVEVLEMETFRNCPNLTTVTFDKNVKITYLSYWLFSNCVSLKEITLPKSLTTIGSWTNGLFMTYPFDGCTGLMSINVDEDSSSFASVDGVLYSKDLSKLYLFPTARAVDYKIVDECKSIFQYAFYNCAITGVDLNNVEDMEIGAFNGAKITSVTLTNKIKTLGNALFSRCTALKTVTFKSGFVIDTLPFSMFSNCNNLATVIFEEGCSVNTFDRAVFSTCRRLSYFEIHMKTPPVLTYNPFGYVDTNTGILQNYYPVFNIYVPSNLVDIYKTNEYWSVYSKKIYSL